MLVWSYETRTTDISASATDSCQRCKAITPHSVRVEWQTASLYVWLRSIRWERWFAKCTKCGTEHQLSAEITKAVKKLPKADPIPFWDRHGGEVLGIVVLAVITWAVLR